MANVGRISGSLLRKNLLRHGEDLAFEDKLLYLSVADPEDVTKLIGVGINTDTPEHTLDVVGTTRSNNLLSDYLKVDNLSFDLNTIKATDGGINILTNTSFDYLNVDSRTFRISILDNAAGTSRFDFKGQLEVNGNIHATGSITADGNLVLGNENTDTIQFNADIISNIIPDVDDTYDLGTLTKSWRQVYVDDMRLGGPEVGDSSYDFTQTSIPGSGTLPAKTFTGINNPQNYTKVSNTFSEGHLTLASNGNGLIELINDTRVHSDLNVKGSVATDNANYILMGEPEYGILQGAVAMSEQTSLTDGVAQLNLTLTLLVPVAPPSFPNAINLLITGLTQRIINQDAASQPLNGNSITAPAAGTIVYVARVNTFGTSTISGTGPGNRGLITVKRNTQNSVTKLLTYGNSTQVITSALIATKVVRDPNTNNIIDELSQEVTFIQPSIGVIVPGYLIQITNGTSFGGLTLNSTFIITTVTAKFIKMSYYDTITGTTGDPFVASDNDSGSLTFVTLTDVGTYTNNNTDLVLTNNVAYPLTTPGFHETIDYNVNGRSVPPGWNTVQIVHSDAGSTSIGTAISNIGIWYYDDTVAVVPVFSNQTFALGNSSIIYSSTVPHYTNSTTYNIGFKVTWNAGKTGHSNTSQNILTTNTQDIWSNVGNKTYNSFGYNVLPVDTTVTNGSGPNSQSFIVTIKSGFGLWTNTNTVPVFTASNGYLFANSVLPSLGKQILFKTGVEGQQNFLEETDIKFATSIGSGSGKAARCVNPDGGSVNQDTPVFQASSNLFDSVTGPIYDTDAVVVGIDNNIHGITHNITDYSTGYLPDTVTRPNFSTRNPSNNQYFTFRFSRTGLSKFRINWTTSTGIEGLWVAMPGTGKDPTNPNAPQSGTVSDFNKWLDASINYVEPNGCALGASLDKTGNTNIALAARAINISFGSVNSTYAENNQIWIRFKLSSNQKIESLYLSESTE